MKVLQQLCIVLLVILPIRCPRTGLDDLVGPFRIFKQFAHGLLSSQVKSRENKRALGSNQKIQEYIETAFPCSLTNAKSLKRPKSVHELRPGDVDIIGAIGDSLTAGFGSTALNILHVFLENRGTSFSIGGEETWRSILTVPNILKMFNPKLFGYSLGNSITIEKASQFNAAEGGAFSEEMPYMAKVLVKRILNDQRVDVTNDWKMINILIGGNNFCSDMCFRENLQVALLEHRNDMISVLRTLRNNLPRTLVNLIAPPHLKVLAGFTGKPTSCYLTHSFECPCIVGLAYINRQKEFYDFMLRWIEIDKEVSDLSEFDLDDFTVVFQPFASNYTFPLNDRGFTDFSYMSADCFHFSQKGNARVANSLWNNLMEPVGLKSSDGVDIMERFRCPTEESPYIFTRRNSNNLI